MAIHRIQLRSRSRFNKGSWKARHISSIPQTFPNKLLVAGCEPFFSCWELRTCLVLWNVRVFWFLFKQTTRSYEVALQKKKIKIYIYIYIYIKTEMYWHSAIRNVWIQFSWLLPQISWLSARIAHTHTGHDSISTPHSYLNIHASFITVTFTFMAFTRHFCPKYISVIQTYIQTLMSGGCHARCRLTPRTVRHADQGNQTSNLPITRCRLYPSATVGDHDVYHDFCSNILYECHVKTWIELVCIRLYYKHTKCICEKHFGSVFI